MSDEREWNPLGIIALTGAVLLVAGVFMEWGTADADLFLGHKYVHYTGWEVINDRELAEMAEGIGTVPGLTLLIGLLSSVFSAIATVRRSKGAKVLSGICLAGCAGELYLLNRLMNDVMTADIRIHGIIKVTVDLEIGYWVCAAGAIVLIIGSIITLAVRTSVHGNDSA